MAAGMSSFGFGTDSGGSVRVPAHSCGIAAVVPTARLLPVSGIVDDEVAVGTISDPRTRVGILARSVTDLNLVLRAITPIPSTVESLVPLRGESRRRLAVRAPRRRSGEQRSRVPD